MSDEDLLTTAGHTSDETEFYTPLPTGYKPGQCHYVVVVGTVMSGLGKGIFASSLAKLLQDKGFRVAPIKLEGYLNIDSGTLNPYRHGEVFVLDDGMECDMDLGTYERMLDYNLTKANFTTSGQIMTRVLEKERHGRYLGRDVQMIPHVTGEVKARLRELAVSSNADVVFVEIGGTVGDYENAYYLEAVRQMAFEEGPHSVCFVALTYVLEPRTLGEQKSKAAQLGLKELLGMGIQPHIIGCRCHSQVSLKVKQKIALYTNVPLERVFSMHDCESVYLVPKMLRQAQIDTAVLRVLHEQDKVDEERAQIKGDQWNQYVQRFLNAEQVVQVAITGKYTAVRDSYASILKALEHAGTHHGVRVQIQWIDVSNVTDDNAAEYLGGISGIIVPGGFGERGTEGKIACIRYARENNVPYLGLCYGFQMAVLEFARNVCQLHNANSTELDPKSEHPVIDILPEQKNITQLGGNMRKGGHNVELRPGTRAWHLYGQQDQVRLRFRHRYEVHPDYISTLEAGGMIFSGKAPQQPIMQILELPDHRFFMGTQAHPELTSRPLRPEAMFAGFVAAVADHSGLALSSVPVSVQPDNYPTLPTTEKNKIKSGMPITGK